MHVVRRSAAGVVAQAIAAIALAFGVGFLLRLAGPSAMFIALVVLLTLLFFFVLAILRAFPLRRLGGPGGRGGPQGPGGGPGGGPRRGPPRPGGVREPRRPFPPRMPPREAAEIDTTG